MNALFDRIKEAFATPEDGQAQGDRARKRGSAMRKGKAMKKVLRGVGLGSVAGMNIAGVLLGLASAAIQIQVFSALLGGGWLVYTIVGAFETAKASSAIEYAFAREERGRKLARAARGGLFLMSFMASLVLVSAEITQPNLRAVIEEEIAGVQEKADARIQEIRARYAPRIAEIDSLLEVERQNRYGDGTFRGPKFKELERLRGDRVAERDAAIQRVEDQRQLQVKEIRASPPQDRRVQNEMVASFIKVVNDVLGVRLRNAVFAFVAAGLIAALMETWIFLLFSGIGEKIREMEEEEALRPIGMPGDLASGDGAAGGEALPFHERSPQASTKQEDAGAEQAGDIDDGENAEREGAEKEDETQARGTSARRNVRNGRKLYSFAGALVLVALLELFTPVAPGQRLMGNAVNAMPQSWIASMVGEEAAQRYAHVDSLIEAQGRQGMISADGVVLARHTTNPDFPEPLQTYLLQVENHRFFRRYVVDWAGFGRAVLHGKGGGSGLIQQITGDVVLENGQLMREGGWWEARLGKLTEAIVSCGLRNRLSAEKLLRLYLQGIYLGHGPSGAIRGFEEAAWAYFDAPVDQLTEAQQLALVALLPAPNGFVKNSEAFARRYETAVGRLLSEKVITAAEAERLRRVRPAMQRPRESAEAREVRLATRHAQRYVQARATDSVGTIRSTLSAEVSVAGRRQLRRAVQDLELRTEADDLEGFVLVADQGRLLAMVGSETGRGRNRADMISAYRPGSVMKPFYYAEHLAQGGSVRDRLPVRPQTFALGGGQTWTVKNYTHRYDNHGPMPLGRALARSVNVAAASVAVGPAGGQLQGRLAGIGYGGLAPYPSSVLGARAVKPIALFRLLQAFTAPYGEIPRSFQLDMAEPVRSARVWPATAASSIAQAMSLTVDDPHGTLSAGRPRGWTGRTHRGKTGTAEKHTSASLFAVRPGGLNVLMGVFRRSGEPMTYPEREGGITGAALLPYVDALLGSDALKQRAGRAFDLSTPSEQQPILKAAHATSS